MNRHLVAWRSYRQRFHVTHRKNGAGGSPAPFHYSSSYCQQPRYSWRFLERTCFLNTLPCPCPRRWPRGHEASVEWPSVSMEKCPPWGCTEHSPYTVNHNLHASHVDHFPDGCSGVVAHERTVVDGSDRCSLADPKAPRREPDAQPLAQFSFTERSKKPTSRKFRRCRREHL